MALCRRFGSAAGACAYVLCGYVCVDTPVCVLIVVWIAVCMHAFVRARVHACVCCRMCGDTRVCV